MKLIRVLGVFLSTLVAATGVASEQELLPGSGGYFDGFGSSVSISGDYAIIGAPQTSNHRGQACIYVRQDGTWSQQVALSPGDLEEVDMFGSSVSIHGEYAIVGSPGDDDEGTQAGAAYIYHRTGTAWSQQAKVTWEDAGLGQGFGRAVSIWSEYALVGAENADLSGYNSGAVFVFNRSGETWTLVQTLEPDTPVAGIRFGSSVALFGLGHYAIIGAFRANSSAGAAFLFDRLTGSFVQTNRLAPPDLQADDWFGVSVAGDPDAGKVVIGADNHDHPGTDGGGAVYVYLNSSGTWSLHQELVADNGVAYDHFGASVSCFYSQVVVGAPGKEVAGDNGVVYAFTKNGSTWSQTGMRPPNCVANNGEYGAAVATDQGLVIVGAKSRATVFGAQAGAAFAYEWSDIEGIFLDSFETGATSRWSSTVD